MALVWARCPKHNAAHVITSQLPHLKIKLEIAVWDAQIVQPVGRGQVLPGLLESPSAPERPEQGKVRQAEVVRLNLVFQMRQGALH